MGFRFGIGLPGPFYYSTSVGGKKRRRSQSTKPQPRQLTKKEMREWDAIHESMERTSAWNAEAIALNCEVDRIKEALTVRVVTEDNIKLYRVRGYGNAHDYDARDFSREDSKDEFIAAYYPRWSELKAAHDDLMSRQPGTDES